MIIQVWGRLSKEEVEALGKPPSINNILEYACQQVLEYGDGGMSIDDTDGSYEFEAWQRQGEESE